MEKYTVNGWRNRYDLVTVHKGMPVFWHVPEDGMKYTPLSAPLHTHVYTQKIYDVPDMDVSERFMRAFAEKNGLDYRMLLSGQYVFYVHACGDNAIDYCDTVDRYPFWEPDDDQIRDAWEMLLEVGRDKWRTENRTGVRIPPGTLSFGDPRRYSISGIAEDPIVSFRADYYTNMYVHKSIDYPPFPFKMS